MILCLSVLDPLLQQAGLTPNSPMMLYENSTFINSGSWLAADTNEVHPPIE